MPADFQNWEHNNNLEFYSDRELRKICGIALCEILGASSFEKCEKILRCTTNFYWVLSRSCPRSSVAFSWFFAPHALLNENKNSSPRIYPCKNALLHMWLPFLFLFKFKNWLLDCKADYILIALSRHILHYVK